MYNGTIINNNLKGCCDANFVGDQNDRKSQTWYVFTFGNVTIAWNNKNNFVPHYPLQNLNIFWLVQ